jgi:hypothetical protein
MQIGKPLRKIIVEPLESPVPTTITDPETREPEPLAPRHEPAATWH